jgi:hypothetical protein
MKALVVKPLSALILCALLMALATPAWAASGRVDIVLRAGERVY